MNDQGWLLTIALFMPIAGAGLLAMMPAAKEQLIKRTAVAWTGVSFALVSLITIGFDYGRTGELQYETDVTWIESSAASYHLGSAGLSVPQFFRT